MTELTGLTNEYQAWQTAQGLHLGRADQYVHDNNLTEEQRAWLRDFCHRWDKASQRRD